jgi:hypothetical protein
LDPDLPEGHVARALLEQCQSGFHECARVRVADEKTNDRIGTVVEVLPKSQQTGDYDSYRIEFNDGTLETVSDLQLSPDWFGSDSSKCAWWYRHFNPIRLSDSTLHFIGAFRFLRIERGAREGIASELPWADENSI